MCAHTFIYCLLNSCFFVCTYFYLFFSTFFLVLLVYMLIICTRSSYVYCILLTNLPFKVNWHGIIILSIRFIYLCCIQILRTNVYIIYMQSATTAKSTVPYRYVPLLLLLMVFFSFVFFFFFSMYHKWKMIRVSLSVFYLMRRCDHVFEWI